MTRPFKSYASATLLALATLISGVGLPVQSVAQPVTIFAAASLKPALDEIAAHRPDLQMQVAVAGSSALARQIQLGAPAQIFVSANSQWMDVLEADGLLQEGSRRDLLGNQLVLIAAQDSRFDIPPAAGFDLPSGLVDGPLAMATVDAVPAGIYGRQALTSLGVWDQVASHVVQTDNVRAALRLVASTEARLGIVYASDLSAGDQLRRIGSFPADSHDPIRYPIALITPVSDSAQQVYDHLISAEALAIFLRHGFLAPDDRQ